LSQRARLRRKRLRDFESRHRHGDALIFAGSPYVTVHPFADDHGLLQKIGWPPEKCIGVDGWWKIHGDVVFLQVSTTARFPSQPVGRYARWNGPDGPVNLHVVVDSPTIPRTLFEAAMQQLVDSGAVARAVARGRALGESLARI
jgi:hypothetical protein